MNPPLSIVKAYATGRLINFVYKSKQIGIKNPLRTNRQWASLNAIGGRTPLNATCLTLIWETATSSTLAISRILSPKFSIIKDFRVFSRHLSTIDRLMLVRWWFSFARFIKKETKSCQVNRTISRTVRWPVWNLVRGSIRIMQRETLVLSCVATNKERAIGMT